MSSGFISPRNMNFVSKRWGWERWICNNDKYCGKQLFIARDQFTSYHYHKIKDEVLYVASGKVSMRYGTPEGLEAGLILEAGCGFRVKPNVCHQMEALEDTLLLEFSTQHFDEDSYRVTTDRFLTLQAQP